MLETLAGVAAAADTTAACQTPGAELNSKSPCHYRGFLLLQSLPNHQKTLPIPGTISHLHSQTSTAFYASANLNYFHQQQGRPSLFFISADISIYPTHLPNTSFSIAITDAVGLSKSDCRLMPQPQQDGRRRSGGGAGRTWWLCEWLCMEVRSHAGGWVMMVKAQYAKPSDVRRATLSTACQAQGGCWS